MIKSLESQKMKQIKIDDLELIGKIDKALQTIKVDSDGNWHVQN